eukprot:COSAG04_NODE_1653_length_6046_cov_6.955608_2_plen_33_part_00
MPQFLKIAQKYQGTPAEQYEHALGLYEELDGA